MSIGRVTQLWRYPVSSAGGELLPAASLSQGGIEGDRSWCLMDPATGEVAAPEKRKRWRPAPSLLARCDNGLALRSSEAWVAAPGPEALAMLERHFGFPVELRPALQGGDHGAPDAVKPRYTRAAIHLLTTASLAELGRRLPGSAVDPRRFRPNIVIDTRDAPPGFMEQSWIGRELRLGDASLRARAACFRCSFTVLAQQELSVDPAILAEVTGSAGGAFGVLCDVTQPGRIELGAALAFA